MKKIIGFIAALVLMITLLPFQQAEAAAVNKHYTVNIAKLDIREKPSPKAKIVGSLKKGTSVFVYNTEPGGWSKIKYNGKAGYVASKHLKAKFNYTMDKYGIIRANYDAGETIRLKVGQRLEVNRVDKLNRNEYYHREMLSTGPADYTDDKQRDIIGVKPGVTTLSILPFSNWEDEYLMYIEVYK